MYFGKGNKKYKMKMVRNEKMRRMRRMRRVKKKSLRSSKRTL